MLNLNYNVSMARLSGPQATKQLEFLVVGAGGRGAAASTLVGRSGGGGAGGVNTGTILLQNGQPYTFNIGIGTIDNVGTISSLQTPNTLFIASGGLAGLAESNAPFVPSEGGASGAPTSFIGGTSCGGGGGATSVGTNVAFPIQVDSPGGNGGEGFVWVDGIEYAGGGYGLNTDLGNSIAYPGQLGAPSGSFGNGGGAFKVANPAILAELPPSNGIGAVRYSGTPSGTGGQIVYNSTTDTTIHYFTSSGTFVPSDVIINGFQPFARPDEYSASLVLAIPGAVFEKNYQPAMGVSTNWQDISGFIRGNNALNISGSLTGSGLITGSIEINQFTSQGYPTSLYVSGSISALFPNGGVAKQGLNLSTGSLQTGSSSVGCVIEAWVAFPTASALGQPYKDLAFMSSNSPGGISNYWYSSNWNGDIDAQPEVFNVSGSSRFVITRQSDGGEEILYASTSGSRQLQANQWNHFAVSIQAPIQIGLEPLIPAQVRQFINGELVGSGYISEFSQSLNPLQVFGVVGVDGNGNPFVNTDAYIQDLRIYNGSNKNYTSSFIPPPSMIIGSPWA
jgi:hypothetical protein